MVSLEKDFHVALTYKTPPFHMFTSLYLPCSSLHLLTKWLSPAIYFITSYLVMLLSALRAVSFALCLTYALAQTSTSSSPFAEVTLTAENITAKFIPYGARLTSLLVPDRYGTVQDIVLGYDNATQYLTDTETNHTYFGPIVGRYANRIKNGTFNINGNTYHVPENEHGGLNTLHGGKVGYDQRNWTIVAQSNDAVTFSFLDIGLQGFPGTVYSQATYAVSSVASGSNGELRPRLTSRMTSLALDTPTPIMLANHIYWNLNAFTKANILNDTTLWMPYCDRYIDVDNIEVPNGTISTVASYPPLDFTSPKLIGQDIMNSHLAGFNSTGYDNAFIIDRPGNAGREASSFPVLSLWSSATGIRMDVSTNQRGLQIYSCIGQNGTIPVKPSQVQRNNGIARGGAKFVNKYGCIVIETQDWIDGVNYPEWGRDDWQIFSAETGPAVNYATYEFSTF
jgi:aldose 1-epimerase